MRTKTVLLCGVGGQGTILAADLLAHSALEAGYHVKVSEIHGMAQRGGAVSTVVRFGNEVFSMVADVGTVDYLVSFETLEALRNISMLSTQGCLLVADETIKPLPVSFGSSVMPHNVRGTLEDAGAVLVPAFDLAVCAGNAKCENVVILGALEAKLNFGFDIWKRIIKNCVPLKTVEANLKAFELGFEFVH